MTTDRQKKEWVGEKPAAARLSFTFWRLLLKMNLDPTPAALIFVRKRENKLSCFSPNDES